MNELAGKGYLALIQADSNGVGAAAKEQADADRAQLFHRNRVLLRRALQKAINTHYPTSGHAPLILLMLGGDDLLMVSQADVALPFVVTLCRKLDTLQSGQSNQV
ncbi:MAG: hypothetical protein ACUVR8_12880 [Acidobacteriota bacterium]